MKGLFGKFKGRDKDPKPNKQKITMTDDESLDDGLNIDNELPKIEEGIDMQEQKNNENIFDDIDLDMEETIVKDTDLEPEIEQAMEPDFPMDDLDDETPATETDDFFADIDEELLQAESTEPAIAIADDLSAEDTPAPSVQAAPEVPAKKAKKEKTKKTPKPKKQKITKVKQPKEPKPKKQKTKPIKKVACVSIKENDYQSLVDKINKTCKKKTGVLFAGAGIDTLPLTMPVNTAIGLSKKGKKCLLIDLDTKRNAIANAFDISEDAPKNFKPHSYETSFENLKIWPAGNFAPQMYIAINELVEQASKKYDFVLINAPYLDGHIDRKPIASASTCALMFTDNDKQTTRLNELLTGCNCKIISSYNVMH